GTGSSSRLVSLPADRPVIFVGDTHGDRDASERVFARFAPPDHAIVFLGDTVDRGPDSRGNLQLILTTMREHPDHVRLLMGNHEAWAVAPFTPADFWGALPPDEERALAKALTHLPFAAHHPAGLLALHGALPDLASLAQLDGIELGSEAWRAITWGDWEATDGGGTPTAGWRRPAFGRATFERRANSLGIRVLVRSHQPSAPPTLFNDRCLTLFTSSSYGDGRRRVAVLRPGTTPHSTRDLDLVEL
ncbi:serine/threonine protein phosphatase, partial [Candidatus Bipolaricaulota bacterium]|nr:serine/threonine protein phosphatase [Candidatus Bipolaricaulota bacterium]